VRRAYYIGWVTTLLPIPGLQFLVVLTLAMIFRANLTVATGLQFVSNPLTAAPIMYVTYQTGKYFLRYAGLHPSDAIAGATASLFTGGVITGLACAVACDLAHRSWSSRARVFRSARQ